MNLKPLILGCLCLIGAATASAQDKIYKRNGEMVTGKVTEISKRTVAYKRVDNPNGPEYTLDKNEIEKIQYENGSTDVFGQRDMRSPVGLRNTTPVNYGKNILAIAPFQVTEHGIGIGLSYERALDKEGLISFYLPVAVTFANDVNDPYYYYYGPGYTNTGGYTDPFFYAMPGIKFYPTGMYGKVRYGVGPSLLVCAGRTTDYYYNYPNYNYAPITYDRFKLGIIVNNSLNVNVSRHMYLGMELGLGLTYLNMTDGNTQAIDGLAQFAFKIGYRF